MSRRILLYSHDTYGLGNIRRNYALALHLVQRLQHTRLLLLTSSRSLHLFPTHPRIDYVKLPEVVRSGRGEYRARQAPVDVDALIRLRREIIRGASRGFRPDLFLVDKVPRGLEGELDPTLDRLHRRKCRISLILRDVLDEPEWTRAQWLRSGQYEALADRYRDVWIFGDSAVFPTAEVYGLDAAGLPPARYCGYLPTARAYPKESAEDGRFLVTVGGGADGGFLLRAVADATESIPFDSPVAADVVLGPYLASAERMEIGERIARHPRFRVLDYVVNVPDRIHQARGVISMGGYNSVCEVLSARTPTLVVPRQGPGREQIIRAECMGGRGFFRTPASQKNLAADVLNFLQQPVQDGYPRPNMTGLLKAGYLARRN